MILSGGDYCCLVTWSVLIVAVRRMRHLIRVPHGRVESVADYLINIVSGERFQ
jgi:hypothetical protein